LSAIVLFAISYFTIALYADSDYFQGRIEQTMSGDSSGRNSIYSSYFSYFIEKTTALEFLIGNGTNSTYVLLGNYAHNDWLEFAINQGAVGVLMYLVYWIAFIWEWKNYRGNKECRNTLGDMIIAYFLISLYSMSIDAMPTAASLCIGYCLAMNERAKTENMAIQLAKKIFDNENTPLNR
jgi:O-antigen ligase